ncbi:hypothetical protein FOCC_FOCC001217 [Frankliniella occidentalis]|nr:hypothetical protein FOCC_FOCC001217 [Frankliniella occidentalis]
MTRIPSHNSNRPLQSRSVKGKWGRKELSAFILYMQRGWLAFSFDETTTECVSFAKYLLGLSCQVGTSDLNAFVVVTVGPREPCTILLCEPRRSVRGAGLRSTLVVKNPPKKERKRFEACGVYEKEKLAGKVSEFKSAVTMLLAQRLGNKYRVNRCTKAMLKITIIAKNMGQRSEPCRLDDASSPAKGTGMAGSAREDLVATPETVAGLRTLHSPASILEIVELTVIVPSANQCNEFFEYSENLVCMGNGLSCRFGGISKQTAETPVKHVQFLVGIKLFRCALAVFKRFTIPGVQFKFNIVSFRSKSGQILTPMKMFPMFPVREVVALLPVGFVLGIDSFILAGRVLKQVYPDTGISSKAMSIMNSFVDDIFEKMAAEANRLAHYNKRGDPDEFSNKLTKYEEAPEQFENLDQPNTCLLPYNIYIFRHPMSSSRSAVPQSLLWSVSLLEACATLNLKPRPSSVAALLRPEPDLKQSDKSKTERADASFGLAIGITVVFTLAEHLWQPRAYDTLFMRRPHRLPTPPRIATRQMACLLVSLQHVVVSCCLVVNPIRFDAIDECSTRCAAGPKFISPQITSSRALQQFVHDAIRPKLVSCQCVNVVLVGVGTSTPSSVSTDVWLVAVSGRTDLLKNNGIHRKSGSRWFITVGCVLAAEGTAGCHSRRLGGVVPSEHLVVVVVLARLLVGRGRPGREDEVAVELGQDAFQRLALGLDGGQGDEGGAGEAAAGEQP